jgi:hypothetical protein
VFGVGRVCGAFPLTSGRPHTLHFLTWVLLPGSASNKEACCQAMFLLSRFMYELLHLVPDAFAERDMRGYGRSAWAHACIRAYFSGWKQSCLHEYMPGVHMPGHQYTRCCMSSLVLAVISQDVQLRPAEWHGAHLDSPDKPGPHALCHPP